MEKEPGIEASQSKESQERIDQEFYSAASRWFNEVHNHQMRHIQKRFLDDTRSDKKEKALEDAFRYQDLRDQLTKIADPKNITRLLEREGLLDKYGDDAKAVYVAEALGILGYRMSMIHKTQRMIDDPGDHGDKEIFNEALEENRGAKELFLVTAEKIYGSFEEQGDLIAALRSIGVEFEDFVMNQGRYQNTPDTASVFAGSLGWFIELKELSPASTREEQAEVIDRAIASLGGKLGDMTWTKYEDDRGNKEGYLSMPDDIKWAVAHGNQILYELQKIRDKLDSN